jgi:two-component system chemotaxis sensor kinase CheA
MDNKELEFQKRLQETFRIEAEEHIRAFSAGLLVLEKSQSEKDKAGLIEVLFREVHSLKGAARSVNQKDIEYICQPIESIFARLKSHDIELNTELVNLFFKTTDWLLQHVTITESEQTGDFRTSQKELIRKLKEIDSPKPISDTINKITDQGIKPPDPEKSDQILEPVFVNDITVNRLLSQVEIVRIPVSKLDPLLMQAEELTQSKIVAAQRADELGDLCNEINGWKAETQKWSNRKSAASIVLWNEWYETCEIRLNKVATQVGEICHSMEQDQHLFDRLVDNHLEAMKQVLMLPAASMVESFPVMVREISHKQNKEVNFNMRGTELEIDKRILEVIKDPLIHLIRNSIDHGISKPAERIRQNKPASGNITLEFVSKENRQVEVIVSDDGNGIDKALILKAAIKSGIISAETAGNLELKDVMNLIYQSGVSTSSIITDISGRGLGLSIVHEKVEKLNGKIFIDSEVNRGTIFRILLPSNLTTFRGIVVKINDTQFILPTMNVECVLRVEKNLIKTVENNETLYHNDKVISIVDLRKVLGLSENIHSVSVNGNRGEENSNITFLVVLVSGESRIAFKVDEIVNEQQVLVKGFGKLLSRVPNISGAAILGSGKVVPVVNVKDLMKSAIKLKGMNVQSHPDELLGIVTGKILVTDDSITSRTLIKNILETAGYQVTTAVDGMDAFSKARKGEFNLVVSDVDMPKLNGFELTLKIKNDKKLCETPVILVTALESHDDRERGIEVGADAYIIKSSFDQSNLLEIIKKLI